MEPEEKADEIINTIFKITQRYGGVKELALYFIKEMLEQAKKLTWEDQGEILYWEKVESKIKEKL